jgi:hypothetical protein
VDEQVKLIFQRALQRSPEHDELVESTAFLKSGSPEKMAPELLWTLLASAEFQCNH